MDYYLSFGLVMGLTAGLSPGPLLTLVVSETLQHGINAGVKVALAPMITDAPIILVILLVMDQVSSFNNFVGALSLLGSFYILYMAYDSARVKEPTLNDARVGTKSVAKGVLANVLSPHPYLFWLAVGAPAIIKSASVSSIAPALFIAGFYLPLVGSKVLLALLVGKYRNVLNGKSYKYIMRFLSLLLVIFAALLFIDGLKLLELSEIA
ncbi:LysE family transporter [Aestuariirhabdus sp. Z084]|uniref:LysE family translocator n=1 Tax=Aestuariirhabdus haliotis TaxID=2918751 RepID=UPI00201B4346|nr:LysE family transporter [Aestuariirhabdus haliotis]MCL6417650.1 LysE family transporter [Aestuariirhabdus haliotis]MCL6421588.1 LysE family transporter [Aestuariirhabdus haliotis]